MLQLLGFCAGIISSMGLGGGILLVPALIYFFDVPQIIAQGVIITIFLPTAVIALWQHYRHGYLQVSTALYLALGAFAGALPGARLAGVLDEHYLRLLFAVFLIISGSEQILRCKKTPPKQ